MERQVTPLELSSCSFIHWTIFWLRLLLSFVFIHARTNSLVDLSELYLFQEIHARSPANRPIPVSNFDHPIILPSESVSLLPYFEELG